MGKDQAWDWQSKRQILIQYVDRTFNRLGFKTGRLSTGTPPRLLAKTIDFSRFTEQSSDDNPIPFSFLNQNVGIAREQHLSSYVGYTNERVVEIVRKNIDEKHTLISALGEGIKGFSFI